MLPECQGKVPSTLYKTIMQWRRCYSFPWELIQEVKYFARGRKVPSGRVTMQIHAWFLDAMLCASSCLPHSVAKCLSLLPVTFHGEGEGRLPGCSVFPSIFPSAVQSVWGRFRHLPDCCTAQSVFSSTSWTRSSLESGVKFTLYILLFSNVHNSNIKCSITGTLSTVDF